MQKIFTYACLVVLYLIAFGCDSGSNEQAEHVDGETPQTQPAPVTAEDVKQKFGEAARMTGEYLGSKSAEWTAEAQAKLDEMKSSVNEWRENNAGPKFDAWREEMSRLTDAADAKLAALKDASAEKWDELKRAADEAAVKARQHWDEGKRQFSGSDAPEPPAEAE